MTSRNQTSDITNFEYILEDYGCLFSASLSFEGMLYLFTVYIGIRYGNQKISKLTIKVYIYAMLFLLFEVIQMICEQMMINEIKY